MKTIFESHEFYKAALTARNMICELGITGVVEDTYKQIKKQHDEKPV